LLAGFVAPLSYADIAQDMTAIGLNILTDPSDLFFNLQHDAEDVSPNLAKRRFTTRINMFPSLLPATLGMLTMKIRFTNDSGYMPQIDLVGGYGELLALSMMSSGDKSDSGDSSTPKPVSKSTYYGLTFTKKLNDKARIYFGMKSSEFALFVKLSEPISGTTTDSINFIAKDNFIYSGLELKTIKAQFNNREQVVIAQVGYGLERKKIVARVGIFSEHVEAGLDIFPEGAFVFHPFWAYHWRF
jgi:hypothetical protein